MVINFVAVSFGPYFVWKIPEALGVAEFERDKNFGDLFLAKLKTTITFAMVIRMTIIIYAFGEINRFKLENQLFTKFFLFFKYYCLNFLNFA